MQVSQCIVLLFSSALARCEVLWLPKNARPAHAHNSMVRACYRYLEGRGSDPRWGLGSFYDHFFVVPNIYLSLICYFVNL